MREYVEAEMLGRRRLYLMRVVTIVVLSCAAVICVPPLFFGEVGTAIFFGAALFLIWSGLGIACLAVGGLKGRLYELHEDSFSVTVDGSSQVGYPIDEGYWFFDLASREHPSMQKQPCIIVSIDYQGTVFAVGWKKDTLLGWEEALHASGMPRRDGSHFPSGRIVAIGCLLSLTAGLLVTGVTTLVVSLIGIHAWGILHALVVFIWTTSGGLAVMIRKLTHDRSNRRKAVFHGAVFVVSGTCMAVLLGTANVAIALLALIMTFPAAYLLLMIAADSPLKSTAP